MLCKLCGGRQHIFCVQNGTFEWWTCQACGGAGTRELFCAPTIKMHKMREKHNKNSKGI